jgi:hypothetical protein
VDLGNTITASTEWRCRTLIGGSATGARNVISGKQHRRHPDLGRDRDRQPGEGNYIGVNAAGAAAVGNTVGGISIQTGATGNTIVGAAAGEGNVNSATRGRHHRGHLNATVIQGNLLASMRPGTQALGTTLGIRLVRVRAPSSAGTAAGRPANVLSAMSLRNHTRRGSRRHGVNATGSARTPPNRSGSERLSEDVSVDGKARRSAGLAAARKQIAHNARSRGTSPAGTGARDCRQLDLLQRRIGYQSRTFGVGHERRRRTADAGETTPELPCWRGARRRAGHLQQHAEGNVHDATTTATPPAIHGPTAKARLSSARVGHDDANGNVPLPLFSAGGA